MPYARAIRTAVGNTLSVRTEPSSPARPSCAVHRRRHEVASRARARCRCRTPSRSRSRMADRLPRTASGRDTRACERHAAAHSCGESRLRSTWCVLRQESRQRIRHFASVTRRSGYATEFDAHVRCAIDARFRRRPVNRGWPTKDDRALGPCATTRAGCGATDPWRGLRLRGAGCVALQQSRRLRRPGVPRSPGPGRR